MPNSASSYAPTRELAEYQTEAELTGRQVLVVEGPQDVAAYGSILASFDGDLTIVPVDSVDPPGGGYLLHLFTDGAVVELGARHKVIQLAQHAEGEVSAVWFLADRDLDDDDDLRTDLSRLLYTDFPAVESYWLTEPNLQWFVATFRVGLENVESVGEVRAAIERNYRLLTQCLGRILISLFATRKRHRSERLSTPFPDDIRKFRDGYDFPDVNVDLSKLCGHLGIVVFDLAVPHDLSCEDIRGRAYGHDVATSLWAIFPRLRNEFGITSVEHLENLLRSQLSADTVAEFPLFRQLAGICS